MKRRFMPNIGAVLLAGGALLLMRRSWSGDPMRILDKLHPSIQPLALKLLDDARTQGIELALTAGYRSLEEQARLYAQGRPGGPPGPIVTNSPPGSSWHNFGLAFDVAPIVKGRVAYPNDPALWKKIGDIGKSAGLTWGGDFKSIVDRPHFEYHPNLTLADARAGKRPGSPPTSIV